MITPWHRGDDLSRSTSAEERLARIESSTFDWQRPVPRHLAR